MADHDVDLTSGDVQQLSSSDQVAAFFGRLGYDISARIQQTPAALGITPEAVKRKIQRIERIADQEQGALQVYFVQFDSVTIEATRALARSFRDRAGNYLLVLTGEYQQLDFVLLEREVLPTAASSISGPRTIARPRVFTVQRRDPGPVALRVLRRLTYTEADPDAQYDKLRSAYTVAEWSEPFFNNRALFADYFLNERLRALPEWAEPAGPIVAQLRALYAGARERFAGAPEATTRKDLVEPVLNALGYVSRPRPSGSGEPDYVLDGRTAGSGSAARAAINMCLAYTWDRQLDAKDETRDTARPNDNPGARVVSALDCGTAPWALLTNGKLWRLYAAAAHSRATNYYEIDLEDALASPDPGEAFRYFWLLFRAAAFQPRDVLVDGEQRDLSFVEQLLHESASYARQLGERLKNRVFEDVFPQLAEGFIAHIRHVDGALADFPQDRLDEVFRGTLTLLYRLLFLLYAESRDLLPVREVRGYWLKSLTRLKREIAGAAGPIKDQAAARLATHYTAGPTATDLYARLAALAQIVDRGNASVNTPLYNGGLFLTEPAAEDQSPEAVAARFLLRHKVPDRYLARALDLLARDVDEKRHDLVPIDYKSLGVRQLGSIYEGLLEFRLRVASEKMAIVKGKKTEEVVPYAEAIRHKLPIAQDGRGRSAAERTLPKGAVYLENNKRERKATGSYYTPDHIVEYIVAHAVGPVLEEHLDKLRPRLRDAERAYYEAVKRREGFRKHGREGDDPEKLANAPRWQAVVDDLFDFRVCDSAMGSGHFLVEAVDFITDRMIDFLNGFPWNPVQAELRRTREAIQAEMERQGVSIDFGKLIDVNLLKRHVLKRCIYGVDLNPMAVELAKLSLWLDCFTLGAPLSFLDHHLKPGNSLIGTTVETVQKELAAGNRGFAGDLFGGPFQGLLASTVTMQELARLPDANVEQSRRSHSLFAEFQKAQAPYRRALDIWVSRHFGNQRAVEYLTVTGAHLVEDIASGGKGLSPEYKQVVSTAAALQDAESFFHWDLEFPEAYVDLRHSAWKPKEEQGFDAVVGNPPWVRQEGLGRLKPALQAYLPEVYDSIADTYVYFLSKGMSTLRHGRRLGMVVPNKWLRAGYGTGLRKLLTISHQPIELIDFGHAPLFEDADTFPCVLVVRTAAQAGPEAAPALDYCPVPRDALSGLDLPRYVTSHRYPVAATLLREEGWITEPPDVARLLEKIRTHNPSLQDLAPKSIYRGIIPGLTEAFFVDQETRDRLATEDPACEPLLRKALRGKDVERWSPEWDGEWLILLKSSENHPWPWAAAGVQAESVFRRTYPSLYKHLKPMERKLRARQDQGKHWWELRSCSYYDQLDLPKICYQEILFHSSFTWDEDGYIHNNKAYSVVTDRKYIVAVLNSSVMWWYMWRTLPHMKDEAFAMQAFIVEHLPIAEPDTLVRAELSRLTEALATNHQQRFRSQQELLSSLATDFRIDKPPRKLEQFWLLDDESLAAEIHRAARAAPAAIQDSLLDRSRRHASAVRALLKQSVTLEFELQRAVFGAYDLIREEIALIRETAPPRDPLTLAEQQARLLDVTPGSFAASATAATAVVV